MSETFKLPPLDIEEYSLSNGLRVVLNTDNSIPVVSIAVYYNVGSRNQREAVKEEKRLRYDNQPYGQIFDLINEMIYKNFANAHSTIGSMEHLDDATVEDVREFFRIYYAPNNAVLTLSGAFDPPTAKDLIETYFGDLASQPLPPALDVSEPNEVAATYKEWEDKLAPFPAFLIGWKIPRRRSPEFNALYLAGKVLYDGDSSRLYQKL